MLKLYFYILSLCVTLALKVDGYEIKDETKNAKYVKISKITVN